MESADESVVFKGSREGISIFLDQNIPFPLLKEAFRRKTIQARHFFGTGDRKSTRLNSSH